MADLVVVRDYITAGWSVVPLAPGQKHPNDGGWLKKTYALQDFDGPVNVGVKLGDPSGGLIDVDLDTPEAVALAKALLPATGAVFGRASKPASHYLFVVPGVKPKAFKNIDGKVLLEIRSTGGQTMFPPSTHPSGEVVAWDTRREPMPMSGPDFETVVARLAVATLIAKNWPSGSRHVASGHLGGVLGRCGYSPAEVEHTVHAIVTSVGEGAWADDNARFARESAEKLTDRDAKVTGGPAFAEMFPSGNDLLRQIYEWLGREGDDQVEELNKKHFVSILGKDMVVGTETDKDVVFQTFAGFEQRYFNNYVGKKKLGKFWLEHPRCRKYDEVVFAPPPIEAKPTQYNLWRGFAVEPGTFADPAAHCRLYLNHLEHVICNGQVAVIKKVLDILAITAQKPGVPTGRALALRGKQGVGKSIFINAFGRLFGRHFTTVSSRKHITGDFNAHLSGKVVVFADEAIWGGNRQDVGALKRLITERTLLVERKGVDASEEHNCIHLFMATNEEWIFPAGDQERRGIILDVVKKKDRAYFNALSAEIDAPEFAPALLQLLQARDVSDNEWKEPLETGALREQQELSSDSLRRWWIAKLDDGELKEEGSWPGFVDYAWLYSDFEAVCKRADMRVGMTYREFSKRMVSLLPPTTRLDKRSVKVNVAAYGAPHYVKMLKVGYVLPTLADCRAFYDSITGTKTQWEIPIKVDPALMGMIRDLEKDDEEDL